MDGHGFRIDSESLGSNRRRRKSFRRNKVLLSLGSHGPVETLQEEMSLDTVGERQIGNRISWRLAEIAPHAAPTCCYWGPPTHSLGAVSFAVVVHGAGVVVVPLNTAGGEGDWGMTNLCGMKYATSGLSLNIGTATVLPSCPLPTSHTSSPIHEATPNGTG